MSYGCIFVTAVRFLGKHTQKDATVSSCLFYPFASGLVSCMIQSLQSYKLIFKSTNLPFYIILHPIFLCFLVSLPWLLISCKDTVFPLYITDLSIKALFLQELWRFTHICKQNNVLFLLTNITISDCMWEHNVIF